MPGAWRVFPALHGPLMAANLVVATMSIAQLLVAVLLVVWGHPIAAAIIVALLLGQVPLQRRFRADPIGQAIKYSAGSSGLFVLGMLVAAIAVG